MKKYRAHNEETFLVEDPFVFRVKHRRVFREHFLWIQDFKEISSLEKERNEKWNALGAKVSRFLFILPYPVAPPPSLLSIRPSIFLPSQKRQKFHQTSVAFRFLDSPQLSNTCPIISPSFPRTPPFAFPSPLPLSVPPPPWLPNLNPTALVVLFPFSLSVRLVDSELCFWNALYRSHSPAVIPQRFRSVQLGGSRRQAAIIRSGGTYNKYLLCLTNVTGASTSGSAGTRQSSAAFPWISGLRARGALRVHYAQESKKEARTESLLFEGRHRKRKFSIIRETREVFSDRGVFRAAATAPPVLRKWRSRRGDFGKLYHSHGRPPWEGARGGGSRPPSSGFRKNRLFFKN